MTCGVGEAPSLRASQAAEEAPNKLALVIGGEEISFAELWRRTEPVIAALPDSAIALTAHPQLDELLVLYACLELNRPLLLLHPRWPEAERQRVTRQLAELALYQGGQFRSIRSDVGVLPEPEDQVLLATSGTTGPPKIVPLSQRNLLAAVSSHTLNLPFESGDRWLLALPFAHIGGLSILLRCLWARSTVVVTKPSNESLVEQLASGGVSLLSVVPTQLRNLVEAAPLPPRLRAVLVGGARAPASLRALARSRGVPALYTYGMTEATSQICSQNFDSARHEGTSADASDSVGKPLPGFEVRTTAGGRIELRGPQVFRGYLGEVTQRGSDDWFVTSDCGEVQPDGSVAIRGRIDDLIISGGENVSPDFVEQTMLGADALQEVCVVGVSHPKWGQMVTALVVPFATKPDWRELCQTHLNEHLAAYARPREWLVVEALHLLPSGKVDRRRMLAVAEALLGDRR